MYKHILLPISNPKNAEYTLKAALRLLDNKGTLILLGVLLARESYPDRNKNYLDKVNLIMRVMKLAAVQRRGRPRNYRSLLCL